MIVDFAGDIALLSDIYIFSSTDLLERVEKIALRVDLYKDTRLPDS